jgi:hypothetical protein
LTCFNNNNKMSHQMSFSFSSSKPHSVTHNNTGLRKNVDRWVAFSMNNGRFREQGIQRDGFPWSVLAQG